MKQVEHGYFLSNEDFNSLKNNILRILNAVDKIPSNLGNYSEKIKALNEFEHIIDTFKCITNNPTER